MRAPIRVALLAVSLTLVGCGTESGVANSDTTGDEATGDGGPETSADSTSIGDGDGDGDGDSTTGDGDGDTGSAGCGMDPSSLSLSLSVGGETRSFVVYVPADYDPTSAYPLIFGFHGGGGSGAGSQGYWGLDAAVGSDAIVVYPDGLPEFPGGSTVWMLDPAADGFVFFDDLLAHLTANLCIDENRVFATGWSMGGYMANSLGCYRSEVLAGIASVSGGMAGPKPPAPPYPDCVAEIPAMVVHGTSDAVIPLSEGQTMRDIFVSNNGCDQSQSPVDPSPCVAYDGCASPMQWCEFAGGHEWPGFAPAGVWEFFSSQ